MQPLHVFLCHSSDDKPAVRELYQRLQIGGIKPWFDEEDLLPGQNWQEVIPRAIREANVVLVCLSCSSVNRMGYVQKEIKLALDTADEQPEDSIFVIPVRLEECDIPDRLRHLHWVNLFEERGYERLMGALQHQADQLGRVITPQNDEETEKILKYTIEKYCIFDHAEHWKERIEVDEQLVAIGKRLTADRLEQILHESPYDRETAMAIAVSLGVKHPLGDDLKDALLLNKLLQFRSERVRYRSTHAVARRDWLSDTSREASDILTEGIRLALKKEHSEEVKRALQKAQDALVLPK